MLTENQTEKLSQITANSAKERYDNLSEDEKNRIRKSFETKFKIPELIKRALGLLESGMAINEEEARVIMSEQDFDDRNDSYRR